MDVTIAIAVCFVTIVSIYFLARPKSRNRFPPGPNGLPILGNSLQITSGLVHVYLTETGKQFGELFSLSIFGQRTIVLNSLKVIREGLVGDELAVKFAGRPMTFLGIYTDDNCSSTSFMTTCKLQSHLRKILHKALNMHGEGVSEMETAIMNEPRHVVHWLEQRKTSDLDLDDVIFPYLANIITYVLIGKRYDYNSDELKSAMRMTLLINRLGKHATDGVLTMFPFLRFLPFGYGALYRKYIYAMGEYYKYYYHAQKETYKPEISRGLVDTLIKAEEHGEMGDNCSMKAQNVTSVIKDSMEAGTLSTRSTLLSLFLVLLHRPEIAAKIQQEIDAYVGRERYPSLKDRNNLPYTEATLFELMRFITPGVLGLSHCTTEDTLLRGFHIPKDTVIMNNFFGSNHDETLWDNPYEFCPERYLDDTGHVLSPTHPRRKNLFSFGAGRRSCPGDNFAKSQIFLLAATLLQRFNFSPVVDNPLPTCDPREFDNGIVPTPRPFKVRFFSRL